MTEEGVLGVIFCEFEALLGLGGGAAEEGWCGVSGDTFS